MLSPNDPKDKHKSKRLILVLLLVASFMKGAFAEGDEEGKRLRVIDEIVVTSQRRDQPLTSHAGNIDQVDREALEWLQAQHIQEVMNRVAGSWVVRGSGQEHQTAVRSPVIGGGGACGAFLPLEDGIPVRPAGFCNINQFIELFTEEAQAIEVIRGPGNALYGSNALHGTINVLMPRPGEPSGHQPHFAVEVGSNDFVRARALVPFDVESRWLATAVFARDGGFRPDSGYEQGKLHVKGRLDLAGDALLGFTATELDQETAGFIVGRDAYKDPALRRSNPDPDAFRDASSQRLYGLWTRVFDDLVVDLRPYLRHSDMGFLHFERPGKPREENGHESAGLMASFTAQSPRWLTISGVDVDLSNSELRQWQAAPTDGNPRQRETFPAGRHYDYEVGALNLGAYVQTEWQASPRLSLGAGLRLEYSHYDYDNRMISGNTREDGTPCGFGGCIYSRPSDRSDSFTDFAPNLSASYRLNDTTSLFINVARGFRVPQTIELYRLQFGQLVTDQDSETLDSVEAGFRARGQSWGAELSVYAMRKRDSAFRDAEGFNVSGARSRHHGFEWLADWRPRDDWQLHVNGAYGRHEYDFDASGRGEVFIAGNDIRAAPHWLGSAELRYRPTGRVQAGLQVMSLGEYYLDSQNRFTYPGHTVLNLRASLEVNSSTDLLLRFYNLADRDIADRADFVMGNYRYLPGRGREVFLELRYSP